MGRKLIIKGADFFENCVERQSVVKCNEYLTEMYRFTSGNNAVGGTPNSTSDPGQSCTRSGIEIPTWAKRVIVGPFLWWVSSASENNDGVGLMFTDNANKIIWKRTFRNISGTYNSNTWNKSDDLDITIPSGATKIYISTSRKADASIHVEPVLTFKEN